MEWTTDWFFDLLYGFQKTACYIIDFIKEIFYVLAGVEKVEVNGQETDLLSNFILADSVKRIFLYVFLISVVLLVMFVIIAIVKSEWGSGNKKSKTHIFSKSAQSFLLFLLIPFLLLAGIAMSNTVVVAINTSMNPYVLESGASTTIGGQILVTSGHNAYIGDISFKSEVEYKFVTGELDYYNMDTVKQYYKIRNIDYFTGILGSLVIAVMFIMSSVMFIQRIFDVILLYIISPVSISTIPIDEGTRFKTWKEMLVAKILSAYGIILTINLFFIIMPQVQEITFFNDVFKNGIVKILFVIGGSYAVAKANMIIAQLTGGNAGERQTQEMFANIRKGSLIAKGATLLGLGVAGTTVGTVLGGKSFTGAKKSNKSVLSGFKNTFKQNNTLNKNTSTNEASLSKMNTSTLKSLVNGGMVGVGKNYVDRIKSKAKEKSND